MGLYVRLKNVYSGEYLYAGDKFQVKDDERRSVFTWRKKSDKPGDWADWKLTRSSTDRLIVRLSPRTYHNEPLVSPFGYVEDLLNDKYRNVYTWMKESTLTTKLPVASAFWLLEADASQKAKHPNRYSVLNQESNELMYVDDDRYTKDASRRHVYTWARYKTDFSNSEKHLWDVEIVSEKPFEEEKKAADDDDE